MLRGTGLSAGNSPLTGEFPAQMASDAENVSISWRHHVSHIFITIATDNPVMQEDMVLSTMILT